MHCLTYITNYISNQPRIAHRDGREYLVARVVMAKPGVMAGSGGPIYYPESTLNDRPQRWSGIPVTLNHPQFGGNMVRVAASPKSVIGFVDNASYRDGLRGEVWLDIEKTPTDILQRVQDGQPVEVSTGMFNDVSRRSGRFNGADYDHVSNYFKPDHLALLTSERGACSVAQGCGVTANVGKCSCGCDGACGDHDALGFPTGNNHHAEPAETPLGLPDLFPSDYPTDNANDPLGLPSLSEHGYSTNRETPLGLPKLF